MKHFVVKLDIQSTMKKELASYVADWIYHNLSKDSDRHVKSVVVDEVDEDGNKIED